MVDKRPYIAITMGDPAGIGPEIISKALSISDIYKRCRPFVIGNKIAIKDAISTIDSQFTTSSAEKFSDVGTNNDTIYVLDPQNLDYTQLTQGQVSATAGHAAIQWVMKAGELAATGRIQAVVTAPINKKSAKVAGYQDIGHMEIFKRQSGAQNVATMLMADRLRVVHLTTHHSLRIACDHVKKDKILAMIELTYTSFQGWGFRDPRIGVAALNPHGSDGGLLGQEENTQISPAILAAQSDGINVEGPIPADTIFNQAINGNFDVVIAMYHDQGHIPVKVHNWAESVSVNLGLPFIRTSVDHGTAFDIAGKGIADHRSMLEAIEVAIELASYGKLR